MARSSRSTSVASKFSATDRVIHTDLESPSFLSNCKNCASGSRSRRGTGFLEPSSQESFTGLNPEDPSLRAVIPRNIIRGSDPSPPRGVCLSRLRRALASLPFDRRIDGDLQNSHAHSLARYPGDILCVSLDLSCSLAKRESRV